MLTRFRRYKLKKYGATILFRSSKKRILSWFRNSIIKLALIFEEIATYSELIVIEKNVLFELKSIICYSPTRLATNHER